MRARIKKLPGQLFVPAERLSPANAALAEVKRALIEIISRSRLTTAMMPTHDAHIDARIFTPVPTAACQH